MNQASTFISYSLNNDQQFNQSSNTLVLEAVEQMQKYAAQVWELLSQAYASVEGGLHFSSVEELIQKTKQWRITVAGNTVIAVAIFKAKKGLKISAFCMNRQFGALAKISLIALIKNSLKNGWIELSENAERFVMTYCNGAQYIVNNCLADGLLNKNIKLSADGYHYSRNVNNTVKEKIIVGTPDI